MWEILSELQLRPVGGDNLLIGIFAEGKNCGTGKAAVTIERSWSNINFKAAVAKWTTKARPLLGIRFLISENWMATIEQETEDRYFLCGPCRDVITGTVWSKGAQLNIRLWRENIKRDISSVQFSETIIVK
jgi:hypothetical protein